MLTTFETHRRDDAVQFVALLLAMLSACALGIWYWFTRRFGFLQGTSVLASTLVWTYFLMSAPGWLVIGLCRIVGVFAFAYAILYPFFVLLGFLTGASVREALSFCLLFPAMLTSAWLDVRAPRSRFRGDLPQLRAYERGVLREALGDVEYESDGND